jgi:hypothetical protein
MWSYFVLSYITLFYSHDGGFIMQGSVYTNKKYLGGGGGDGYVEEGWQGSRGALW